MHDIVAFYFQSKETNKYQHKKLINKNNSPKECLRHKLYFKGDSGLVVKVEKFRRKDAGSNPTAAEII